MVDHDLPAGCKKGDEGNAVWKWLLYIAVENNKVLYVKAKDGKDYFIITKDGKRLLRDLQYKE